MPSTCTQPNRCRLGYLTHVRVLLNFAFRARSKLNRVYVIFFFFLVEMLLNTPATCVVYGIRLAVFVYCVTWSFIAFFFWHLSSGYSCSICSYTHTRTPYTRTPHSHHTCTIRPTTTHRYEDRVLLEITGNLQGFVCDGRVAVPLWHHAWEATEIIKGTENSTWWGTRVAIPRNRTRARPLAHLRANQLSYRSSSRMAACWSET